MEKSTRKFTLKFAWLGMFPGLFNCPTQNVTKHDVDPRRTDREIAEAPQGGGGMYFEVGGEVLSACHMKAVLDRLFFRTFFTPAACSPIETQRQEVSRRSGTLPLAPLPTRGASRHGCRRSLASRPLEDRAAQLLRIDGKHALVVLGIAQLQMLQAAIFWTTLDVVDLVLIFVKSATAFAADELLLLILLEAHVLLRKESPPKYPGKLYIFGPATNIAQEVESAAFPPMGKRVSLQPLTIWGLQPNSDISAALLPTAIMHDHARDMLQVDATLVRLTNIHLGLHGPAQAKLS